MERSKRQYKVNDRHGFIVRSNNAFYIEAQHGIRYYADQQVLKSLFESEIGAGRPAFFENASGKTVTLPKRIWDLLEKPYSISIFEILENHFSIAKKLEIDYISN